MSLAKLFSPWGFGKYSKPVGPVTLDRSNRLFEGLTRAYLFRDNVTGTETVLDYSDARDHLAGAGPGISSSVGIGGWKISTALSGMVQSTAVSVHSGNITLFALGIFTREGANNTIISADSTGTGERDFQFRFNSSNVLEFIPFVGGTNYSATGATAKNATDLYAVAATYDGETARVFLNGHEDGTDTTPSGSLDADNAKLGIGARATSSATSDIADVSTNDFFAAYIWDRALSAEEILSLSNDPYQLFKNSVDLYPGKVAAVGVTPKNRVFHGPFGSPVLTGPF